MGVSRSLPRWKSPGQTIEQTCPCICATGKFGNQVLRSQPLCYLVQPAATHRF